jgi:hypothetical protein
MKERERRSRRDLNRPFVDAGVIHGLQDVHETFV